jgi:predicted transposase YbfD/YdcC
VVITAAALHTHANTAKCLVGDKQAHYLFVVKANQPTLLDRVTRLAWHRVPVGDRTRDQAHGPRRAARPQSHHRQPLRLPHAAQAIQITRKTRDLGARRWHTVVVYAITSLSFAQARLARRADLIRGHWMTENGLHWVRDVTFAEDGLSGPHRPLATLGIALG